MSDLLVFDLQRYALHDGPGIRTTVFIKGCPLNCIWCHNPESISPRPQQGFIEKICVHCGRCLGVCSSAHHRIEAGKHVVNFTDCTLCDSCNEKCIFGAIKRFGVLMTTDEIVKVALQDRKYYENSGGGLTLSGGEPMSQLEGTVDLLKSAKAQSLHTCLDTSGCAPTDSYERVLPYVDLFLFDYKLTDDVKHRKFTGISNKLIMKNMAYLDNNNATIHLRCPIIPGINDDDEHLNGITQTARKYKGIVSVEVMAYNNIGQSKAKQIGVGWHLKELPSMTKDEKKHIIKRLDSLGCPHLKQ